VRDELESAGYNVTPALDRDYFKSVYFREPGGVLFEIATDGPGFTVDEPAASLGRSLKLPAWLEPRRFEIEALLPNIHLPIDLPGPNA
jgi:glyoxalase family protein